MNPEQNISSSRKKAEGSSVGCVVLNKQGEEVNFEHEKADTWSKGDDLSTFDAVSLPRQGSIISLSYGPDPTKLSKIVKTMAPPVSNFLMMESGNFYSVSLPTSSGALLTILSNA